MITVLCIDVSAQTPSLRVCLAEIVCIFTHVITRGHFQKRESEIRALMWWETRPLSVLLKGLCARLCNGTRTKEETGLFQARTSKIASASRDNPQFSDKSIQSDLQQTCNLSRWGYLCTSTRETEFLGWEEEKSPMHTKVHTKFIVKLKFQQSQMWWVTWILWNEIL